MRPGGRIGAIDVVKAAAIVAVVITHAGRAPWDPRYGLADALLSGFWAQFHVPSFLLVSGLLYRRMHPIRLPEIGRRLARVLVPYGIASLVAQGLGLSGAHGIDDVLYQLATGSSLGIYYYVFLLTLFIPALWPLSRLGERALSWLLGVVFAASFVFELVVQWQAARGGAQPGGLFWLMRNPLNYSFFMFVTGWWCASHLPALRRMLEERRGWLLLACLLAATLDAYLSLVSHTWVPAGIVRVAYTLAVVVVLSLASRGREVGRVLRFLSENTLSIYLYHHMFQLALSPWLECAPGGLRIPALLAAGLAGSSALCLLGRRLLGRRARLLLGA